MTQRHLAGSDFGADGGIRTPGPMLTKHLGLSAVRPTSRVRACSVKLSGLDQGLLAGLLPGLGVASSFTYTGDFVLLYAPLS